MHLAQITFERQDGVNTCHLQAGLWRLGLFVNIISPYNHQGHHIYLSDNQAHISTDNFYTIRRGVEGYFR